MQYLFTKLGDTAFCHLVATIKDPYPVDAEGHLWFKTTPFRGGVETKKWPSNTSEKAWIKS